MSANQHEYYIRSAAEDEARGPFTFAQLARLASDGQLTRDILYYEAESERWMPIGKNETLSADLFPGTAAPPSPALPRRPVCMALLLAGALALVPPFLFAPAPDAGGASGLAKILTHPFALFGVIDLVLGVAVLAAGMTPALGKILRLRAALGLGFLGALFWLQEQPEALAAAGVAATGLWFATFAATRRSLALAATAGLAGIVFLAYCLAS
jgi:hypothetical protein